MQIQEKKFRNFAGPEKKKTVDSKSERNLPKLENNILDRFESF